MSAGDATYLPLPHTHSPSSSPHTQVGVLAAAKLSRIVQEPDFNIVSVGRVSKACKSLCWWSISICELIKVGAGV